MDHSFRMIYVKFNRTHNIGDIHADMKDQEVSYWWLDRGFEKNGVK